MVPKWNSLLVLTHVILSDPLQWSPDGMCECRQPSCKHSTGAEWGQLCPIQPEHHGADPSDGERDPAGIRSRSGPHSSNLLYWWELNTKFWSLSWFCHLSYVLLDSRVSNLTVIYAIKYCNEVKHCYFPCRVTHFGLLLTAQVCEEQN